MSDTDTLFAQALALVNEDRRGALADIITAMLEVAVRTTNDMWITRLSQWEPTPAEDAIGYVVHGPAFGSNPEQVQQVRDLIRDARARTGAVPTEDAAERSTPQKLYILAVDAAGVLGVYRSEDALRADARRMGLKRYSRGEFVLKGDTTP